MDELYDYFKKNSEGIRMTDEEMLEKYIQDYKEDICRCCSECDTECDENLNTQLYGYRWISCRT